MDPHPDFTAIKLSRDMPLGAFRLTPLSPEFVDEDLNAVLSTAPLLAGIFGTWPEGLTRDANLIDLAWHEREFTARRSFSWIIRDGAGAYAGCFYLFPELGTRGKGKAALWLCDIPNRTKTAQDLKDALGAWLETVLPDDYDLAWTTRPLLD